MNTEEIKDYIWSFADQEWYKERNLPRTDDRVLNEIQEAENVVEELNRSNHRWWDTFYNVVKIGEKYFMYECASANRDESIFDLGWQFDWKSVKEVVPVKKIIEVIEYEEVK